MSRLLYSIRDWERHFEVSQSKKVKRALSWVALPTKHDGKSFRRIMLREDGPVIYGAWVLIVQVASKCPRRGVLADADGPLDATDLAIKTGCRPEVFDNALKVLASKEIGWMLVARWEDASSTLPLQDRQTEPTNQPTNSVPPQSHSAQPDDAEPDADGGRAGGNGFSSGWGKVADRLTAMGCSRWRETIAEAKAAGCNPGLALTLIDYGKSNGYGTGGIVCRLVKARPTLPVDQGWPAKPVPPTTTTARRAKSDQEAAEFKRWEIIKFGRKAGKTQDQIDAELTAAGLDA